MFALFGSPFPKVSRLELLVAIYSDRSKQWSIPMYLSNAAVMLSFAIAEAPPLSSEGTKLGACWAPKRA